MPDTTAPKTWEVYVMDLFHSHDSGEHRWVSGFSTREDACDYARARTWSSVQELCEPGMTAEALKQQWWMFGESASVSGEPHYSGADEIDYFVANAKIDWIVDSNGVAAAASEVTCR